MAVPMADPDGSVPTSEMSSWQLRHVRCREAEEQPLQRGEACDLQVQKISVVRPVSLPQAVIFGDRQGVVTRAMLSAHTPKGQEPS